MTWNQIERSSIIAVGQQNTLQAMPLFTDDLFARFISYCEVKQTTLQGYMVCIRQFVKWLQSNGIIQPKRDDIRAYKGYLDGRNFSAGTRSQYLRAVKHFFKWTASEGLYPNIADNVKGAKVRRDNTKKEAFSESDIQTILHSIDRTTEAGKRDYAMILLAVTGGLRIIEMQRADVQDMATIQGQRVLYIQGKGHDEKDDYTKIVPEVAAAIDEYLQSRHHLRQNDPLFTGTSNRGRGQRMAEPSFSRIIKTRFKAAGFDSAKLTAHSLRHTSNTLLFKAGADLVTVQKHARHCDPATTEIYLHAFEREKDHSEQNIYNQIFGCAGDETTTTAADALQRLNADAQQKALAYIMALAANSAQAAM